MVTWLADILADLLMTGGFPGIVSMVRWVVGSILYGGPIELFLVPASVLRLVPLAANRKE